MKIHSLYSGSKGNATRILSDDESVDILIDVGVSWTKICDRTSKDYTPSAIIVTHEHTDHIKGVGIAGRKTGCPIYILEKCYKTKKPKFFKNCDIHFFKAGQTLEFGDLHFFSFSVRHDCQDIVCFKVQEQSTGKSLGYLTDTGAITKLISENLSDCNAYCLEMDYDTIKLAEYEEYDPVLKHRISSSWGHLSNQQAIEYIKNNLDLKNISFILALHLSENTNSPELIFENLSKEFSQTQLKKFHCAPTSNILVI